MQRRRALLFFIAGVMWLIVPALVWAQIVPQAPAGVPDYAFYNLCRLGELMQNIINFLVGLSVSVAAAMFAYAGFLYTTGHGNPTQIGRAHKIFQNVLIGFLIAISAWLVVQTFLSVVFDKKFWIGGNWNELRCISESSSIAGENKRLIGTSLTDVFNKVVPQGTAEQFLNTFGTYTVGGQGELGQQLQAVVGSFGEQCVTGFCSPQVLKSLGYTTEQANAMSCIAMTESGGNPYAYNRGKNNESSACGLFQIQERTHWGNRDLNSGACSTALCTNSACNIQVAYNLSQQRLSAGQSPYGDWTCPGCNNKAVSCVQQYDSTGYNRWYQ